MVIIPLTQKSLFLILNLRKRKFLSDPVVINRGQVIQMEDKAGLFQNIRGDLSGAASAAIITLPMSIGYGMIAFGTLRALHMRPMLL